MPRYNYTTPLVGQKFNRLTVLAYSYCRTPIKGKGTTHYWVCRCDCGTECPIRANDLIRGRVRSCGCYQKERVAETFRRHGACGTTEYIAWQNIKSRCLNPQNREFPNYGKRGVTLCAGWLDFAVFLADMGYRPDPSLSIDRVDNSGNYSCGHCEQCLRNGWPMNCRWATKHQQSENKRTTHRITYNGRTQSADAWGKECGLRGETIINRIEQGWTTVEALTVPARAKRPTRVATAP